MKNNRDKAGNLTITAENKLTSVVMVHGSDFTIDHSCTDRSPRAKIEHLNVSFKV